MVNLLKWKEGPAFLGGDVYGGNVVYRCSAAGLELMPVVGPNMVVFALMRGDVFLAGLKMERLAADQEFVEEITGLALKALEERLGT